MLILITKDGATKIPREVSGLEDAKAVADSGFHVDVEVDGAMVPLHEVLAAADGQVQPVQEAAEQPSE